VRIAAERADGWNLDATPEVFDPPYAVLVERLEQLGRPLEEITISVAAHVNFPDDPGTFVRVLPTWFPDYDFDQVVHGPTPQDAIASFRPFIDAGVTHFQIAAEDLRSLEIFATEVAPALTR
jgi:alkanesulfonate monooxygenase SsuD/methylene tetrahydromethanopterin reductase-like flavin-dependent oxidoreductase (luciferase family)